MATERRNFTKEEIEATWKKAVIQPNNNPHVFRKDYAGAWIKKEDYGNVNSIYGWEIDHLNPLENNGDYNQENLYPLHWKNNRKKDKNYPEWQTEISSEGVENIVKIQNWYIKE